MAGPRRTKLERERDLATLAEHYLHGKTQAEIAELMGVTQQQISYDLRALQRQWQKSGILDFGAAKGRELARIDANEIARWQLYAMYQAAWAERSAGRKLSSPDGKTSISFQKDSDHAFLDGMQKSLDGVLACVKERCKLLGLYAPEKQEHSGEIKTVGMTLAEWKEQVERNRESARAAEMIVFGEDAINDEK